MAIYGGFVKKIHDYGKLNKLFKLSVVSPLSVAESLISDQVSEPDISLLDEDRNCRDSKVGPKRRGSSSPNSIYRDESFDSLSYAVSDKFEQVEGLGLSPTRTKSVIGWTGPEEYGIALATNFGGANLDSEPLEITLVTLSDDDEDGGPRVIGSDDDVIGDAYESAPSSPLPTDAAHHLEPATLLNNANNNDTILDPYVPETCPRMNRVVGGEEAIITLSSDDGEGEPQQQQRRRPHRSPCSSKSEPITRRASKIAAVDYTKSGDLTCEPGRTFLPREGRPSIKRTRHGGRDKIIVTPVVVSAHCMAPDQRDPLSPDGLKKMLESIMSNTDHLLGVGNSGCPSLLPTPPDHLVRGKARRRNCRLKAAVDRNPLPDADEHVNDAVIFEDVPRVRFLVRFMGNTRRIHTIEIASNERMERVLEAVCALEPGYRTVDLKLQRRDEDIILFHTPERLSIKSGTFLECLEVPGYRANQRKDHPGLTGQAPASADIVVHPVISSNNDECSGTIKLRIQYTSPSSGSSRVQRAALEYERNVSRGDKVGKLLDAFASYASLNPKRLKLSFDGAFVDPEAVIQDTELEDGDVLDAISS